MLMFVARDNFKTPLASSNVLKIVQNKKRDVSDKALWPNG